MYNVLLIGETSQYQLVDFSTLTRDFGLKFFLVLTSQTVYDINGVQTLPVKTIDETVLFECAKKYQINHIVCYSERHVTDAAKVRDRLKLPGLSYQEAVQYRDKRAMHKTAAQFSLLPRQAELDNQASYEQLVEQLATKKIFIKHKQLAGSEDVYLIQNQQNFNDFLMNKKDKLTDYIAQQYMEGDLYHAELVIENNQILYLSTRQYSCPNHDFVSRQIPLLSIDIIDQALSTRIKEAAIVVQQGFKFTNGVMHSEFFLDNTGQPVFLETAIRPPGGAVNQAHARKLNISFETLMIYLELGLPITLGKQSDDYYLNGYFPKIPGKVTQLLTPDIHSEFSMQHLVKVGEVLSPSTRVAERAASILAWNKNYQQLYQDFLALQQFYCVKVATS